MDIKRCIVCREEADSEPGHGYYHATCSCPDGSAAYVYACNTHFDDRKALHKAHLKYPEEVIGGVEGQKEEEVRPKSLLLFGGARQTVLKQLECEHQWHGPCMDGISRYNKCTKCFCIERDLKDEAEYWKREKELYGSIQKPKKRLK